MEAELKNLIDKIKKEGVEEAEREASSIIEQAKAKAKGIIKEAEQKESAIIQDAQLKAGNFKKNSEKAFKQVARDVLLTLRERVTEFFDRILKKKISEQLKPEILAEVLAKIIANYRKNSSMDIEVIVSQEDRGKLEKLLFAYLSKEAKDHLTLIGNQGLEKGFRIGEKGKDSYLDFTDEAITEAFKRYLNPKLVEMLDIDLGLGKEEK